MKVVKKVLSLVLTLAVAMSTFAFAFAEKPEEYEKTPYKYGKDVVLDNDTPVIYVPGIFNTNLVSADGKSLMFPTFTGDDIIKLVKKLMKLEDTGDYDGFVDSLINQMNAWVDGIQCDDNGDPVDKSVRLEEFWTHPTPSTEPMAKGIAAQIGEENVWVFTYDWRRDIKDIVVNELRPYVEYVKQYTGSDKVSMFFMSMGCTLGNVYLSEYGDCGDLENYVLDSGAQGGVSIVADVMGDEKLHIDRQSLVQFIESAEDGIIDEFGTVSGISTFVSGYVVDNLNECLDRRSDELLSAILALVGKCPGVWELGKHEDVERYINKYLDPVKNKVLIDKLNYYYTNYQDRAGEIVTTANEKGYANVRLICHYNCKRVPVTENVKTLQTDFLIDTEYESLGATVLDLYETFDEGYKVAKGDNQAYLSPDYMVDASTCADPDHTWFIKNAVHCCNGDVGSQLKKFAVWLALAKGDVDINTNPRYPQYMIARSGFRLMTLQEYLDRIKTGEEETEEKGGKASAPTSYTYTTLTVLGQLCIALVAVLAVVLIVILIKKKSFSAEIDGVLTSKEIKNLPTKQEKKAAKANNKELIKKYKKERKAHLKSRKEELKSMDKKDRKLARKEDKKCAKADKKQAKSNIKQRNKQAKSEHKRIKAEKKQDSKAVETK